MDNPSSVPPASDVNAGGADNVPTSKEEQDKQLLTNINESSGREYKTLEEAQKGVKDTYGFIGKMGEVKDKAQRWDELQAKTSKTQDEIVKETYNPGGRIDRIEFSTKHPEAASVIEDIASVAKAEGKSMAEVYQTSSLKELVEIKKKEQEASNPDFVTSGQRLAPGQTKTSVEEFNQLSLEEQRKIIEKMPQWDEKLPKTSFSSTKRTMR